MTRRYGPSRPVALPEAIAAGPDPRRWADDDEDEREDWASRRWGEAGLEWSKANGYGSTGWRDLLSPEVRYAVSALGRAHKHHAPATYPGDPWERP